MRFNRFLLTSCAAICLALPAISLADPPQGKNQQGGQQDHKPGKGGQAAGRATPGPQGGQAVQGAQGGRKAQQGGQAARHVAPGFQGAQGGGGAAPAGAQRLQGGGQGGQQALRAQGHKAVPGPAVSGPGVVQGPVGPKAPQAVHRGPVAPGVQAGRAPAIRQPPAPPASPALTGWNSNVRGPQRAQLGQQWRGQHQNLDQNAPWRGNHDWWRSYPSFRLFTGARVGFFFFPDYGYISAPQQYRDHHWQAGDYLPSWFWRYSVKHYASYGLPRPPVGCGWIWLNGDVALVDRSDGYILDIVYNVW